MLSLLCAQEIERLRVTNEAALAQRSQLECEMLEQRVQLEGMRGAHASLEQVCAWELACATSLLTLLALAGEEICLRTGLFYFGTLFVSHVH